MREQNRNGKPATRSGKPFGGKRGRDLTGGTTTRDKELIRTAWESGVSSLAIAAQYGVRDATVRTWALRGGWVRKSPIERDKQLPARLETEGDHEPKSVLLRVLRAGGSVNLACRRAGVPQQTVSDWMRDYPELRREIERAKTEAPFKALEALGRHAELEHRAAAHILAHHPETRDEWTTIAEKSRGSVNVIINFSRDDPSQTVEVEAEPITDVSGA